jgi:hypothetical protein
MVHHMKVNFRNHGKKHAGENFADLLDLRDTDLEIPIQMGDAATRNIPKKHETNLALCLVHASAQSTLSSTIA